MLGDDVERKARSMFSASSYLRAVELLQGYEDTSLDRTARVRLAALKLSQGDLSELARTVLEATIDYRDVLAWAEHPRQMRLRPGKATDQVLLQDRQEYLEWLES